MRKAGDRICQDIKNLWPAAAALAVYTVLMNFIFHAFCPMVIVTGLPCPGCGMSRSLFFLATGRPGQSWRIHPMGIPTACLILYFLWNRYFLGRNARGMKSLIIATIVLLAALYLWRMYLYFPDRLPYVYRNDNLLAKILPFYERMLHALRIL
ncbi:MAG: DUF2752 domain-containing protein [Blautia sp.]|nr:DUF2752 domain-containing protein [Blautia sp.]MCM1200133.1 DUF2752 domain-containing protein [Bacteroides fragilis]